MTAEMRGRDSDGYLNDCPRCGFAVYEHVDNDFQVPVLWEGLAVHGHVGCLIDLAAERRRDSDDAA